MKDLLVAPSILAADFGHLADEVSSVEKAGADWLHLDVMDGNFVDNISFGSVVVEMVRARSALPVDVHLMIDRPDHYLKRFTPHASSVTVHVEAYHEVGETLRAIRREGCKNGLALNPGTPLEDVKPFLTEIDLLLIMTVQPGFGGQPFRAEMLEKIRLATAWRAEEGLDFHIQVDGGIDVKTARLCQAAGANVFVAGTSIFRAADRAEMIRNIRQRV